MNIQSLDLPGVQERRREDLAAAPLGIIGNLQVKPEHGGTARASRRSAVSHLLDLCADLTFRISRATPEERRQRAVRIEVHDNSRRIGNLLGSLTGSPKDGGDLFRIKGELEQLSGLVTRDLADLPGGAYALSTYLSELTRVDLEVMRDGMLGHPNARAAVMRRISPDLRVRADKVLKQVEKALNQRLAQVIVEGPLQQIRTLMLARFLSKRELAAQLISLSTDLAGRDLNESEDGPPTIAMLDTYFGSLPRFRLQEFSLVFQQEILDPARDALRRIHDPSERRQALDMLYSIRRSLAREISARLEPVLRRADRALSRTVNAEDRLAASKALHELHLLVGKIENFYGWLPEKVIEDVREAVGNSLSLFRDTERNPYGMLNIASLHGLDDAVLLNLRKASHLHSLGLEFDPDALDEVGLSRVYAHIREFFEESAKIMSKYALDTYYLVKLQDLYQTLSLIAFGEKRRKAEAMFRVMRARYTGE